MFIINTRDKQFESEFKSIKPSNKGAENVSGLQILMLNFITNSNIKMGNNKQWMVNLDF